MLAPDLIPVLQRVAAKARDIDAAARRPEGISLLASEAIVAELTGVVPSVEWRASIGHDEAAVVCLAKSVRILAAMLAGREGAVIPIAGILDDMAGGPPEKRAGDRARKRQCLSCGTTFRSAWRGNRLCTLCGGVQADQA